MTDDIDPDLQDLLAGWAGRDLPADRCDAILARLTADAGFRRSFATEARTLAHLRVVQSAEPRWLRLADELGWAAGPPADGWPGPDFLANLAREPAHRPARRRRAWAAGAVMAAGFAVGVWWVAPGVIVPDGPRRVAEAPDAGVAALVAATGVAWDSADGPAPRVGDVLPARRLRAANGTATVALFGGATVTAAGPFDLELKAVNRVACHRGRMLVRVPDNVVEFTVLVPGAAVVDQRTEFGINVTADGSHLAILKGSAAVLLMPNGGPVQSGRTLAAGQAVGVDPAGSGLTPEPYRPGRFPAELVVPVPVLNLGSGYSNLIRSAGPWGYWRFRGPGALTANEVPGRPGLRAVGPGMSAGGRGAAFPVGDGDRYLSMDGTWTPPARPGFAIECWAASEAMTMQTLVALAAGPDSPDEPHHILIEISGRRKELTNVAPGAVRFLYRLPAVGLGGLELFSDRVCVPYRWHHVVAQRAGDRLELYLDGTRNGSAAADPGDPPTCRLLLGRLKRAASADPQQVRAFVGLLDEVAVYDRPLAPDEIRRHAAGGR